MLLSIIVPCFNEEAAIPYFYEEMNRVLDGMHEKWTDLSEEFLFVDDGSRDKTLEIIKSLREKDERVRFVSFSRNFGKEAGIYAGLDNSKGDYVVRSFFARMFYRVINSISDAEIVDGARDYRIMTRQMAEAILSMSEYNRFTKGIYGWVGFKTKWIEFENVERVAGETKWSFWGLFRYAIEGVLAFSTVPLELILWIGVIMSGLSFIALIVSCIFYSFWGFLPLIVSLIVFIGAMQTAFLGVISIYLAKTYLETKKRPIYIYKEKSE